MLCVKASELLYKVCQILGNILVTQVDMILDALFGLISTAITPAVCNNLCKAFRAVLCAASRLVYLATNITESQKRQQRYVQVFTPVINFLSEKSVVESYSNPQNFHQLYSAK